MNARISATLGGLQTCLFPASLSLSRIGRGGYRSAPESRIRCAGARCQGAPDSKGSSKCGARWRRAHAPKVSVGRSATHRQIFVCLQGAPSNRVHREAQVLHVVAIGYIDLQQCKGLREFLFHLVDMHQSSILELAGNWNCHACLWSDSAATPSKRVSAAIKTFHSDLPVLRAVRWTNSVSSSLSLLPFQQLSAKATTESSISTEGLPYPISMSESKSCSRPRTSSLFRRFRPMISCVLPGPVRSSGHIALPMSCVPAPNKMLSVSRSISGKACLIPASNWNATS
jgi:hypothetical protein